MQRATKLARQLFPDSTDELVLGGVPLSEMLAKYPTPFYVYDLDHVAKTYADLRERVPDSLKVYYSFKANPSLAIAGRLAELGAGGEIASGGELALAQQAQFPPEKIIFAGPAKSEHELEQAIKLQINSINVESFGELKRVVKIAKASRVTARVSLRINPAANLTGGHQKMGGVASPFGIDEELLEDAVGLVKEADSALHLMGIHVYAANQILDHSAFILNVQNTLRIADLVAGYVGGGCNDLCVNIGGGLGIAYYKSNKPIDFEALVTQLSATLNDYLDAPNRKNVRFIIELGRFLVARSGIFVSRVVDIKESRGKTYAVLDGGMHNCAVATSNFGQGIRRKFPLCHGTRLGGELRETYSFVGPLCTPMDNFGDGFVTPKLGEGDAIVSLLCGAYGYTGSPQLFLSHGGCSELAASRGQVTIARQPQTPEDLLRGQSKV